MTAEMPSDIGNGLGASLLYKVCSLIVHMSEESLLKLKIADISIKIVKNQIII